MHSLLNGKTYYRRHLAILSFLMHWRCKHCSKLHNCLWPIPLYPQQRWRPPSFYQKSLLLTPPLWRPSTKRSENTGFSKRELVGIISQTCTDQGMYITITMYCMNSNIEENNYIPWKANILELLVQYEFYINGYHHQCIIWFYSNLSKCVRFNSCLYVLIFFKCDV